MSERAWIARTTCPSNWSERPRGPGGPSSGRARRPFARASDGTERNLEDLRNAGGRGRGRAARLPELRRRVGSDLTAAELSRLCQGIEVALGRDRRGEKATRTMEIDLLLFGEEVLDGQDFRAPQRGISRTDNLVGLADLDPSIRIPRLGPVTDLLAGTDLGGVRDYEGGEQTVAATLRNSLYAG